MPEYVASSLRLPVPEIESRLRSELAAALYVRGIIPFGKAREPAGVSLTFLLPT
jgi:predicted HTH domain antitoxin